MMSSINSHTLCLLTCTFHKDTVANNVFSQHLLLFYPASQKGLSLALRLVHCFTMGIMIQQSALHFIIFNFCTFLSELSSSHCPYVVTVFACLLQLWHKFSGYIAEHNDDLFCYLLWTSSEGSYLNSCTGSSAHSHFNMMTMHVFKTNMW